MTVALGYGAFDLALIIPVLLILIGAIVGFAINYGNLKIWMEEKSQDKPKPSTEEKSNQKLEWKLVIPGTILIILGGILIYLSITEGSLSLLIYAGMIFMIIGPLVIIYSLLKLRK
jgi:uncharacterized membrane protein HdeD (DUF308 family)